MDVLRHSGDCTSPDAKKGFMDARSGQRELPGDEASSLAKRFKVQKVWVSKLREGSVFSLPKPSLINLSGGLGSSQGSMRFGRVLEISYLPTQSEVAGLWNS